MRLLAALVGVVTLAFAIFHFSPAAVEEITDVFLLDYLALTFTFCVVVMLIFTRQWGMIGLGLLATMVGDALIYGQAAHVGWYIPVPTPEWYIDVIRACFVAGCTFLAIGLVMWVREQRRGEAIMTTRGLP